MTCRPLPLPIACWSIALMLAPPTDAIRAFTPRQRASPAAAPASDVTIPASLPGSTVSLSATGAGTRENGTVHPAARAALLYFSGMPRELHAFLRELQDLPLPADARAALLRQLPRDGELRPTPEEAEKLGAIARVSRLFGREDHLAVRLITAGGQAFVGLHERTVLVITREALWLLSAEQLVAAVAHEFGHDFYWTEYETARRRRQIRILQELELRCDGLAVMALRHLGTDPQHLITAVTRLTHYNQLIGATATATRYVPLKHRVRFIAAMIDLTARPPGQMPWRRAATQ